MSTKHVFRIPANVDREAGVATVTRPVWPPACCCCLSPDLMEDGLQFKELLDPHVKGGLIGPMEHSAFELDVTVPICRRCWSHVGSYPTTTYGIASGFFVVGIAVTVWGAEAWPFGIGIMVLSVLFSLFAYWGASSLSDSCAHADPVDYSVRRARNANAPGHFFQIVSLRSAEYAAQFERCNPDATRDD